MLLPRLYERAAPCLRVPNLVSCCFLLFHNPPDLMHVTDNLTKRVKRGLMWAAGLLIALIVCYNLLSFRAVLKDGTSAPRDPETGIMLGAEPVRIDRGRRRACVLLHGWLTTPADFGALPQALDAAGWDVYAPLQAGHGTCPANLRGVTADDLLCTARRQYCEVRERYDEVALVGFSMGGAIATIFAGDEAVDKPDRLALVAPYYAVRHHWHYVLPARWWSRLTSPALRYAWRGRIGVSVNRKEGRGEVLFYTAFPTSADRALFAIRRRMIERAAPERVTMPVLLLCSTADHVSSLRAAEDVFARFPSADKRMVVFNRSDHHILHDYDRAQAIEAIVRFLEPDGDGKH